MPSDPRSAASVFAHGAQLRVLVTGWIALDSASALPVSLVTDTVRLAGVRRFALVTTFHGAAFHPTPVRVLAADPALLGRAAGAVSALGRRGGYDGFVLDFKALTAVDVPALSRVVRALTDSAHAHGIPTVALAVPAEDTAAYPPAAIASADLLLVQLYDQHWAGSPPGALAAPEWVRRRLATRVAQIGAAHIVAGFPLFGYRWRRGGGADVVSYADATRDALAIGRALRRDPATWTLHAEGPDSSEVWVADAALLDTLVREATSAGVTRVALWRLGLEDPAVWSRTVR